MAPIPDEPTVATAHELRARLARRDIGAREVTESCLARVAAREPEIRAWRFLDPDRARAQAEKLDRAQAGGQATGPLFGLPVGIKDIFDTADMPTEYGSSLHAGRRPARDSAVVERLRAAGAVIMGKTVTTEFATFHPGPTRNPHDPARTPGGSSSGSAAAVAAGMVPLAIGSQTNGSVIRPASFCGVVGYKPSFGLISRRGCLRTSRHFDHVGVFARDVLDTALLVEVLAGHDPDDPDTSPTARPPLAATAASEPPVPPRLAFVRGLGWEAAEPATRAAFEDLARSLAGHVEPADLPPALADGNRHHRIVYHVDLAHNLARDYATGRESLSPRLVEQIEEGRATTALAFLEAYAIREQGLAALAGLFAQYDAILTPAALGEAPLGEPTGDPVFCTLWSFLGTPAVSLPLLRGPAGLPLGVQLVGAPGDDARLLRTARWLSATMGAGPRS
jgi:Asp-tRNA(Asn)/Glu-tRNA(Gln) amidotransferase A subunit family amidase